jgi:hypothetical protein
LPTSFFSLDFHLLIGFIWLTFSCFSKEAKIDILFRQEEQEITVEKNEILLRCKTTKLSHHTHKQQHTHNTPQHHNTTIKRDSFI